MNWLAVLRAYSHLGVGVSRYPEDVCRGMPDALPAARQLAGDGLLYRNPATGYFTLTEAGETFAKSIGD